MEKENFYCTVDLEKVITNRKKSLDSTKVEWFKMHCIIIKREDPFIIYFKYGISQIQALQKFDIQKRNVSNPGTSAFIIPYWKLCNCCKKERSSRIN